MSFWSLIFFLFLAYIFIRFTFLKDIEDAKFFNSKSYICPPHTWTQKTNNSKHVCSTCGFVAGTGHVPRGDEE